MNNARLNISVYYLVMIFSVVSFLSLYVPFLYSGQDLWDGVIISNALESKNREIYWNWFLESGWFLVPLMYDFFFYLGLGYFSIITTILIFHILSAFYIYKILKELFELGSVSSTAGFLIFLLSPVWGVYVSTVFLMHSTTLFIALFCLYNILKRGLGHSYGYQILSLLSVQQASMPVLILGVIAYFIVVKKSLKTDVIPFSIYFALISLFFLFTRIVFPAHGLYDGYNTIDLSRLTDYNYYFIFHQFVSAIYPFYYIAAIILIFFYRPRLNSILLVFLSFMTIIPFVLVGKPAYPSHLIAIQGWDQRQAIALIPMMAIFFAFFCKLFDNSKLLFIRGFGVAILSLFILNSTYVLAKSLGYKYRSVIVQTSLLNSISDLDFENYDCAVAVNFDQGWNFKHLSQYEYAYIGKSAHGSDFLLYPLENNIPYFEEEIYRRKYIVPDGIKSCSVKYSFYSNVAQLRFFDIYFGLKEHVYNLEEM